MITLKRGMVVSVNLDPVLGSETDKARPCIIVTNDVYNRRVPVIQVVPITAWNEKKAQIRTMVELIPNAGNGLTKHSAADCLQTRPVDHRYRLIAVLGELTQAELQLIDEALKVVFALK